MKGFGVKKRGFYKVGCEEKILCKRRSVLLDIPFIEPLRELLIHDLKYLGRRTGGEIDITEVGRGGLHAADRQFLCGEGRHATDERWTRDLID